MDDSNILTSEKIAEFWSTIAIYLTTVVVTLTVIVDLIYTINKSAYVLCFESYQTNAGGVLTSNVC